MSYIDATNQGDLRKTAGVDFSDVPYAERVARF
jgi:hypothetical protein